VLLAGEKATGSPVAFSARSFLFGEPPYSVFDVLLGFVVPDEGLLYLLQPRNLALAFAQAIHFGINFGLATLPFWLLSRIHRLRGRSRLLGYVGCAGLLLIPLGLVVYACVRSTTHAGVPPTQGAIPVATVQDKVYCSEEYGISFRHPEYLELHSDLTKDRAPAGTVAQMISISAASFDPLTGIFVRIIEDPLRNEVYPEMYPPGWSALRVLTSGDLANLSYGDDTPETRAAVLEASDRITKTRIGGYDAGSYRLALDDSFPGHLYMRGAHVMTERRDLSLLVVGSDEPGVSGSVGAAYIDSLWGELVESLQIDF
jgi:hypothetical protein